MPLGWFRFRSSKPARRAIRTFCIEMLEARELLSGTATLRIVTYNVYSDIYSQGITAPPQPDFETVLEGIGAENVSGVARPIDILALQETASNIQTVAPIVNALNAHYGAGTYSYSTYQALSTGATDGNGPNALIYNTTTVTLVSAVGIGFPDSGGPPRQPVRYEFRPVGGSAADDFYVYNDHFKSGDQFTDNNAARRQAEGQAIRADAATLPTDSRILYVGDYNSYFSTDPGYATVTAAGPNQGIDPINQPIFRGGPRATRTDRSDNLSTRLDFQLATQNVLSDPNGLHLIPGSYHVFGNDGSVSNVSQSPTALAGLPNRTAVLRALVNSSDHLPVVADYTVTVTDPVGPTIGALAVNPTSVSAGATVVLTANNVIQHGSGSVASVSFYRESNGIPGLQVGSDSLVGTGTQNGAAWTLSTSTNGLGGGIHTYYAEATDTLSRVSDPVSTTLSVSGPATPTIGSLTVSPTSVAAGTGVTLTAANVTKQGGSIRNVEFYRDTNGTPGLQVDSDLKLGNGTQGGTSWLFSASTFGLPAGTQTFYAVATDTTGTRSATAAVALTVTTPQAPTIGSFTVSPTSVSPGSPVTLQASNMVVSGAGIAGVAFYLETNGVPGLQPESDTPVGAGVQNGSTWTASVSTADLPPGGYTYYAVATATNDQVSAVSSASLTVNAPSLPLVNLQILASTSPNGPFTSSLQVSPSQTIYYIVVGQLAPVGSRNGSYTITSLTTNDGINSLSFNLLNAGTSALPISFVTSTLATPSTDPAAAFSWASYVGANSGTLQSVGGGINNQLSGVRPIHAPGVLSGALAPEPILIGSFTVGSGVSLGATSQITGSFGGTSGAFRINNGSSIVLISSSTESGDNPLLGITPLTLTAAAALPTWLAPGSAATWDAGTHTLSVTGAATIIADPGADSPNIVASGAAARLAISPATVGFVHLGGVTLTGGASITVPSVSGRTHTNHNVVVIDSTGGAPTFSIDSASEFDLADNDLIVRNGNLAGIQALANTGRDLPPGGGGVGGDWAGHGLTSSTAAAAYGSNGYEYATLGIARNSDLLFGSYATWQAGSSTLTLNANDVIVKYTYNGDFTLDGKVNDDDATLVAVFYDGGATTTHSFIEGDTNGDGKVDDDDATVFSLTFGLGASGDQL